MPARIRHFTVLECVLNYTLAVIILVVSAAQALTSHMPAPDFYPAPYNVTVHTGDVAVLGCSVYNLGTKTVVWRRLDSSFPLTSGPLTIIADKRMQVVHVSFKNQWDLMIKNVTLEDEGVYECQIASTDRTVRRLVTLNVIELLKERPEIKITEPQYIERGESIVLQCNATGEYYPPDEMDWFLNGQKLVTHKKKGMTITKHYSLAKRTFTSVLQIDRANMEDDGNYVCRSSNMQIISTKVHILNAENSQKKRGTLGLKDADSVEESNASSVFSNYLNTFVHIVTATCGCFLIKSIRNFMA